MSKNVFVNLFIREYIVILYIVNTLYLGVYGAVGVFNRGNIVKYEVFERLDLNPGFCTVQTITGLDK